MSDFFQMMFQGAAGAGGAGLNVEEVFSTYVYTGNNDGAGAEETQTITNGIDLSGEGGLVWLKKRSSTGGNDQHFWYDTERGATKRLISSSSIAEGTSSGGLTQFNSDGFLLGGETNNYINDDYVSWTFRKAPKFFDIQTWTGDSGTARAIPHNLGSVPGMIIVKRLNSSEDWPVWHRDINSGSTKVLYLNQTGGIATSSSIFASTQPTATNFYVGNHPASNNSGDTYVAYIFAHNNGDGEFGPDSDQDIIKCGYFYGNGSAANGPSINLGFEPQWVFMKNSDQPFDNWILVDNIRGIGASGPSTDDDYDLNPNSNASESPNNIMTLTPNGFKITSSASRYNGNSNTIIYMAIRRGPMAVPESATDVFGMDFATSSGAWTALSGFPIDFLLYSNTTSGTDKYTFSRLTSPNYMKTNNTAVEVGYTVNFDRMDGIEFPTTIGNYSTWINWMWRRAPNFFDQVAWEGSGTSGYEYIDHNLGVTPEMIWFKNRDSNVTPRGNWYVWHKDLANSNGYLFLNSTSAEATDYPGWANGSTAFNDTTLTVLKSRLSYSGESYIAYLFASVNNVSKVGSFTGNGSSTGDSQNIDCGFSSGARFVLVKAIGAAGAWFLFDTERGIVAGNDSHLSLNSTDAADTSRDLIDPYSSGFTINYHSDWGNQLNGNGQTYIFYAIA